MSKNALRRADFKTSIILFLLSLGMLFEAMSFPMTDSYGGVQNAWYLSPALLPLLAASALILLSLVLFTNAVRSGGARDLFAFSKPGDSIFAERNQRLLAILFLICGYVFLLIPRVDFFVATAFFLLAFILAFYPDRAMLLKANTVAFVAVCAVAWLLEATGLSKTLTTTIPHPLDIFCLVAFVAMALANRLLVDSSAPVHKRINTTVIVSVVVPALLTPAFKYGLLVPLPTEGAAIELMEQIRYGLRELLQN